MNLLDETSISPPIANFLALKVSDLYASSVIASALAPDPFPPWISTDTTFLISYSTGSTKIPVTVPATDTLP